MYNNECDIYVDIMTEGKILVNLGCYFPRQFVDLVGGGGVVKGVEGG